MAETMRAALSRAALPVATVAMQGAGFSRRGSWRPPGWRKQALAAILSISALFATAAWAHSWYPYECCSDRDCFQVFGEPVPGGYRFVHEGRSWVLPESKVRVSQDGFFHICILPGAERPLCAFAPIAGT